MLNCLTHGHPTLDVIETVSYKNMCTRPYFLSNKILYTYFFTLDCIELV